jgi:hypothetical protein
LVGPTRLGSARGSAEPQVGSGRWASWTCRPARLDSLAGRLLSSSRGLGLLPSPPRGPAASALPLRADRAVPRGGLGRIRCGEAGSGAAEGRACVHVSAVARVRVRTPEGCSGKSLNGLAATRTRRRGGGRARRGRGAGIPGLRRGRAVRGAPASRARGTTRRR